MRSRPLRAWAHGAVSTAAVTALLCTAGPAGAAEAWPPGGAADGVRVVQRGDTSAIVFDQRARKLYRAIAGKRVTVSCTQEGDGRSFGFSVTGEASTELVAPRRRRLLRLSGVSRGADYCRVWLPKRTVRRRGDRTTIGPTPVVAVALTERGVVHLDEEAKAIALFAVFSAAGFMVDDARPPGYPSPARLVRYFGRAGRTSPIQVVAIANPTDTPPPGKVGYYSDGSEHAAVVTLSAAGRRLFIERLTNDELRTNVLAYVNGFDDGE